MAPNEHPATSHHFTLQALADGVWAAIPPDDGAAVCNAGIVDLGDRTLLFDTFQSAIAARDLRAAAEALTGRPVGWVVNSHWHGDHVLGNSVFAGGAPIVATGRTRELIASALMAELAEDRASLAAYLVQQEARVAAEPDEKRRRRLAARLATNRLYAAELPALEVTLPDQTFEDRVTFYGSRRTADLMTYGGGHTASDAFLYLPAERIAFFGDLLFVGMHPYVPDGDPVAWVQILQRMERMDIAIAVPGHGPVGTLAEAPVLRQYLADLTRLARAAAASGRSADEAASEPVPEAYQDWGFDSFFATNLRFLHGYLSARHDASE